MEFSLERTKLRPLWPALHPPKSANKQEEGLPPLVAPAAPSTARQLQRRWQSQFCKKLILLTYLTYWNKTHISCRIQSGTVSVETFIKPIFKVQNEGYENIIVHPQIHKHGKCHSRLESCSLRINASKQCKDRTYSVKNQNVNVIVQCNGVWSLNQTDTQMIFKFDT